MNVLIACECSGTVRDAFRDVGHDAISCDLKPCERGDLFHIQGDALEAMVWANQTATGQNRLPPSHNRSADRARTYVGIAKAMASQWNNANDHSHE